jgi:hypothetical protein
MVSAVRFPFQATDPSQWRLIVREGRQSWHYVNDLDDQPEQELDSSTLQGTEDAGYRQLIRESRLRAQNLCEKYWLGQRAPGDQLVQDQAS